MFSGGLMIAFDARKVSIVVVFVGLLLVRALRRFKNTSNTLSHLGKFG